MSGQDSISDEKRSPETKTPALHEKENDVPLFVQVHDQGPRAATTGTKGDLRAEPENLKVKDNKFGGTETPSSFPGDSRNAELIKDAKSPDKFDLSHSADESVRIGTEKLLKASAATAYESSAAAYLTVANTLADDAKLRSMVTDSHGMITRESIDNVLRADAGAVIEAGKSKFALPQELTSEQRQSLDLVRSHIDQINAGSGQSIIAAATRGGISAASVELLSSKNIEKVIADSKIDPQKIDRKVLERIVLNARLAEKASKPEEKSPVTDRPLSRESTSQLKEQSVLPRSTVTDGQAGKAPSDKVIATKSTDVPLTTNDKLAPRIDVAQIADGEFSPVAKQVLADVDKDHTGHVSKEQFAGALEDPSFTGKEAQVLAAMYKNFEQLENLGKQEGHSESKSITAAGLDKFNEVRLAQHQRVTDAYDMKSWAHQNLSKFESNKSQTLTRAEIESALKDPKVSDQDKKMLETVNQHYSEMGHFWESGVNLRAFDDYAANINKDTDAARLVSGVFHTCYSVNKGQKPEMSHDLYADKNNPLNSIIPDAIRQGSIGDCYFVSSLAAVAEAHPEMVKNSIKDNGDGSYTVTFPGAKDEAITVKAPTQAEQGLYNHASPEGLWASTVEKAYGKYRENHAWVSSETPEEGADGGGIPSRAMNLLTGSKIETNTTTFTSQATIAGKLEHAFSSHPQKAVTAGINGSLFSEQTADKFYKGHAYTITGFVPDGNGGGRITIRNPWGGKDGTTDGTITVSLGKFMKNFSEVSYEK